LADGVTTAARALLGRTTRRTGWAFRMGIDTRGPGEIMRRDLSTQVRGRPTSGAIGRWKPIADSPNAGRRIAAAGVRSLRAITRPALRLRIIRSRIIRPRNPPDMPGAANTSAVMLTRSGIHTGAAAGIPAAGDTRTAAGAGTTTSSSYSARRAITGSMRVARRAGIQTASSAMIARIAGARAKTSGSSGFTP